jgi:ribosome-associated translation inhibitor RaiA
MAEQELGGNIVLSNFEMDAQEMVIVKKMVGNYAKKIKNFHDYQELRLEMKTSAKGKTKKFEIKALLLYNGDRAASEATGFNPFVLINEVLEKILSEVKHKVKKE